ncbi:hypothetical protein WM16_04050 [Burkholderia ubonensis]|uniref:Uncharacterized protein n=1 Tax=Burkholderia ubonensis TaxID=101571 RepID=A0A108CUJ2_9BURK|nr:hypothetical protein WM16_04050 [Burkholderia ubonensis]
MPLSHVAVGVPGENASVYHGLNAAQMGEQRFAFFVMMRYGRFSASPRTVTDQPGSVMVGHCIRSATALASARRIWGNAVTIVPSFVDE